VEAEMAEPVVLWKTVAWINDDKHSGCSDTTVVQATLIHKHRVQLVWWWRMSGNEHTAWRETLGLVNPAGCNEEQELGGRASSLALAVSRR
jgi:hypothetical protein